MWGAWKINSLWASKYRPCILNFGKFFNLSNSVYLKLCLLVFRPLWAITMIQEVRNKGRSTITLYLPVLTQRRKTALYGPWVQVLGYRSKSPLGELSIYQPSLTKRNLHPVPDIDYGLQWSNSHQNTYRWVTHVISKSWLRAWLDAQCCVHSSDAGRRLPVRHLIVWLRIYIYYGI